ncbi:pantothenate synthetase [Amylibacter marinus]|uniref:Pantothenate synthetase n=1 Tax=Amylibacter marinus TaxID=1475483 RepID=A0ABQ5VXR1_9RHOB|nr:pantoate--beta-alanine ligase [Amylibacter marinus]GLQ36222.1 pantothenate synthetase [Amylibacter marinus]
MSTRPIIFRTVADMRAQVALWRAAGDRIALVPTMGGLHAGHQSLVSRGVQMADRVITTIFVNPTQFGAGEDLDSYPRQEAVDVAMIAESGGAGVFIPSAREMYPEGFATKVEVAGLTDMLCGARRPGHFDGVTQVVSKLLNQAGADMALFGEKDWQQLAVIRRMVQDLDIPTRIVGVPIVRDDYGLALSSRNSYLSDLQLEVARKMNVILKRAAYDIGTGGPAQAQCATAAQAILDAGFESIDYVECRDAQDLSLIEEVGDRPARLFAAAHLGSARLIDNLAVN